MSRYYLTIDPGIEGTGFAIWDANDEWNMVARPVREGSILPGSKKGANLYYEKGDRVLDKLRPIISAYKPEKCWCEFPKLMQSNFAATAGGNIFKLAFFVGTLKGMLRTYDCSFTPVDVNVWKGQMTKEAVDRRIAQRLDGASYGEHVSDAVGIGLWAKGVWTEGRTVVRYPQSSEL